MLTDSYAARPSRLRRGFSKVLMVVLVLVMAAAAVRVVVGPFWTIDVLGESPDRPPVPSDLSEAPLGAPPAVERGLGQYKFLQLQDDGVSPVAYDPCRPIHYVVRPDGEIPGGAAILESAIRQISEKTGLQFIYDGPTDEAPSDDRKSYQPEKYGKVWAPVLIAWSSPEETPALAGNVVGQAGSTSISTDKPNSSRYVTGSAEFDAPELAATLKEENGEAEVRGVLMHELGHLVGLGHVEDQNQLMYFETDITRPNFGTGDLEGLNLLGSGACFKDL